MAVIDVQRVSMRGEMTEDGTRATDTYRVTFDAMPVDINAALTASHGGTSIPSIADRLASDLTMVVRRIGPAEIDGQDSERLYVAVPVEYSDYASDQSGQETEDPNPLLRPADITWRFQTVERVAEKDINDVPIQNRAGDAFDPPLMETDYLLVCEIRRNVASHSPADALAKMNTTNDASVTIAGVTVGAGQALMREYSAERAYENGVTFARQTFEILFSESFDREVANVGYYFIDGSDGDKRKRFLDDEGRPDDIPRFIQQGAGSGDDAAGVANYLTFQTKESSTWSSLNLPTTFPDS